MGLHDAARAEMYLQNARRERAAATYTDYADYLRSLEMVATIAPVDAAYLPRVVQLVTYDRMPRSTVRLTRRNIFLRDGHTCQYCGRQATTRDLNLDHVMPRSRGGPMTWENVVCSCRVCNLRKGGRTPQQASMPLLAVPYRPSWVEHLILSNRNILADQMEFLRNHLPRNRRAAMMAETVQ